MKQVRLTSERAKMMQTALQAGEHTVADLQAATGMSWWAVNRWLKGLLDVGVVHVARWAEDERARAVIPVYKWGAGKDADRRQPRTAAERMAATRARRASKGAS